MPSDGLLLAYLVSHHRPDSRDEVRKVLEESAGQALSVSAIGQSLIRRKLITPQEFIACRALIDASQRTCGECSKPYVAVAGARRKVRRCAGCGNVNIVEPAGDDDPLRTRSSGRNPRASRRTQTASARRPRQHTGHTSRERPAVTESGREVTKADSQPASTAIPKQVGRYPILEKIGDGGMGLIYRAREPVTNRVVALKVLRKGTSADAERRFQREAQAIARLSHPAIVKVHDVGRDEALGQPFFTMDLIEGRELEELRRDIEPDEFVDLVATVSEGLHHVHEQGIVHRDIKPQNILIDMQGRPKIADFGLARDLAASSMTREGDLVGTPLYMAPEQLRGDPTGIDRRTDIYALGVLLYHGLTGHLPIDATSLYDLQQRIKTQIPPPPSELRPGLSPALDGIVLKALEKRSDDRYPTAAHLARDLRAHLAGESVDIEPVGPAVRASRRAWAWLRSPWGVVTAGGLLLTGLVGGFAVHVQRKNAEEEAWRADLDRRRSLCLKTLTAAQSAFADARRQLHEGLPGVAMKSAELAAEEAAEAVRLATQLGTEAPPNVRGEADNVRFGARVVHARALASGSPSEQERGRDLLGELSAERPVDMDVKLELGRMELEAGHVRRAAGLFKQILAQDETRLDAYYYRAETNRLLGQLRFATFDYERALQGRDRLGQVPPAHVLVGRALTLLATRDAARAREDLQEAQNLAPQDPKVRLLRVAFLQSQSEEDEALRELDLATRSFPESPEVRLAAGLAWAAAGVAGRARAELDAALELSHSARMWLARGRLRALTGDAEGGLEDLSQAARRAVSGDPVHREITLARARTLRGVGRFAEAQSALAELAPPNDGALDLPPVLERLELEIAKGEVDAAGLELERIKTAAPGSVRTLRSLAWLAVIRDDRELARSQIAALLTAAPRDPVALGLLAGLLQTDDRPGFERAATRARQAAMQLALEPGLWIPVDDPLREAISALDQGRRASARAERLQDRERDQALAHAEAALQRAARLAPWWTPTHVAQAQVLAERGRTEDALRTLEQALNRAPISLRGDRLRAQLLTRAGRHAEAVKAYGAALAATSGDHPAARQGRAELLLARARSQHALGQTKAALTDLDQATETDPKLVDAFRLRATLRRAVGDGDGAQADAERVLLLKDGYVRVYDEARRKAWDASRIEGDHISALRELEPAFEVVSRRRDPKRAAELYFVRAFMNLRCVRLRDALIDQAAMLELTPTAFAQADDELISVRGPGGSELGFDLERVLRQVDAERDRQVEVDPEFLEGYMAAISAYLLDESSEQRLRAGLRALGRFLDRRPGHASALLLRSVLLLELDSPTEALRCVEAAREARAGEPLAYASYQQARILAKRGDADGALRALRAALDEGYQVYRRIEKDDAFGKLRGDPRYEVLIRLSQGSGYLATVNRGETLSRQREGAERQKILRVTQASATTGIEYLTGLVQKGNVEARAAAARLYFARGKLAARLRDVDGARRDLAAAIEIDPAVLLDWGEVREAARVTGPLRPASFKSARPLGEEGYPTRFRRAVPTLLALLSGETPKPDELGAAADAVERSRDPRLAALAAPLLLAQGDADGALAAAESAADEPGLAALCAWFSARVLVSRGETREALTRLRAARAGGLRGSLEGDPVLDDLARDPRFGAFFERVPVDPSQRWRDR